MNHRKYYHNKYNILESGSHNITTEKMHDHFLINDDCFTLRISKDLNTAAIKK